MSGDRIENGHGQFSPVQAQEQRRAFRFRSSGIGVVVTRQLLHRSTHIPKADRGGSSTPRLLWRRGLIRNPADQPDHRRANMVNGLLIRLHTVALCLLQSVNGLVTTLSAEWACLQGAWPLLLLFVPASFRFAAPYTRLCLRGCRASSRSLWRDASDEEAKAKAY
jgi:hypothetical protein